MSFLIDNCSLIEMVESQPCLWDHSFDSYKNKMIKKRAWKTVCGQLCSNFELMDDKDKSITDKLIKTKWYNIRDSFIKSRRSKTGQGIKKKYMYHDQLLFLLKTIKSHETDSTIQLIEDYEDSIQNINDNSVPENLLPKRNRKQLVEPSEREILQSLKEKDDVAAFLDSIAPAMRQLKEDRKFVFRIEVMQLLEKHRIEASIDLPRPASVSDDSYQQHFGDLTDNYCYAASSSNFKYTPITQELVPSSSPNFQPPQRPIHWNVPITQEPAPSSSIYPLPLAVQRRKKTNILEKMPKIDTDKEN